MEAYKVYYHRTGGYRAVKQGFCWEAFCIPWFWAFLKKLWLLGTIGLIVQMGFGSLAQNLMKQDNLVAFWIIILLLVIYGILHGVLGNQWWMNSLVKRGFEYIDTVIAKDPEAAIIQVASRNEDGE